MNHSDSPVLRVKHLHLSYGHRQLVKDLSFDLMQGQWLAITGTNGSGKSTLLRAIVGLHPYAGEIQFPTLPVIGYLPQQSLLDFQFPLRVSEFVALGLWHSKKPEKNKSVDEALRKANALDLKDWPLQELSRGQFQRIALARALVHQPQLLILDEPVTGLDETTISDLFQLINQFRQQGGSGLIVLHDEARRMQLEIEKLDLNQATIAKALA